jgi:hypothetical protein
MATKTKKTVKRCPICASPEFVIVKLTHRGGEVLEVIGGFGYREHAEEAIKGIPGHETFGFFVMPLVKR